MITPDIINALFELVGAGLTSLSVFRLYKHKCVRGIHPAPIVFFSGWGVWNFVIYYPSVDHVFSTIAAVILTIVNVIWLCQYFIYRKN